MPRKPLGKAQTFTKAELAKLAEVSAEDIERAKLAWRQDASAKGRDLLDAGDAEEESDGGDET